jgi:hypothetical protein
MADSLERIAQTIDETLRDVVFDIKFLGDFINKPADGDFQLLEVRVERGALVLDCGSGTAIAIEAPTRISAQDGTVRVFEAARVALARNGVLAVVAVRGDEIVEQFPPEPERRFPRASIVTPLAEFVFAHHAPGTREGRSSIDMSTVVLLGEPPAKNP